MKNKKGIVLVACYFVIATLAVLGSAFLARSVSEQRFAERQRSSTQAFYYAEAGLERAAWYLTDVAPDGSNDGNWRTSNYPAQPGTGVNDPRQETCSDGSYIIWVENEDSDVRIYARGTSGGITRELTQRISVDSIPAPFEYAVYVGGAINDSGATNLTVNGDTQEDGPELPTVDMAYFSGLAIPSQRITGNYTFVAGTYNGVWYIDGNVNIESNVTINGSIISTGHISTAGFNTITVNATLPQPALIAQGNFDFKDSSVITVNGIIYVGADMTGNFLLQQAENITFNGTLIVAGNLNIQNSNMVAITYDEEAMEDPPVGFSGSGEVRLVEHDWQEF